MDDRYAGDYKPQYDRSWALVIGINDYQYARPLSYATQDAEAVVVVLGTLGFPQDGIRLLTDGDACKARIEESYLNYIGVADSPDDRIVVFFAGHGVTRPAHRGPVGYLVPVDGDPDQPTSLIRLDQFTRNADLIPAKHMLFIFDSCFSGLALHERRAAQKGAQRFVSDMLQRWSRQAIAAGKGDQEVADGGGPDGRNSIFTGYLLEALRGKAVTTGGVLTANGVMHYVYERVAGDPGAEQTPHYGHLDGDGDFILAVPEEGPLTISPADAVIETSPPMPAPPVVPPPAAAVSTFAERSGYTAPDQPNFGRNHYSAKLGNVHFADGRQPATASSWLAVLIEPVGDPSVSVNLVEEVDRLSKYAPVGTEPYDRFLPPREVMTTIDSVILFDKLRYDSAYWARYLRIERAGNIEFCESLYSFFSTRDARAFRYVQIVGVVWQLLFFAKLSLAGYGYEGAARVAVNLVGTGETILADFADQPGQGGKKWRQPGSPHPLGIDGSLLELKCLDPNLHMEYQPVLGGLDHAASRLIIDDLAKQLGLAYNHQSEPRCFNHRTDVFPWGSFFGLRQMHS
jgi:hypothetical protein